MIADMEHPKKDTEGADAATAHLRPEAIFDDGTDAGTGAETAPYAPQPEEEDAVSAIQRLEAEKSDLTDRLLRVVADMENLRRRTERDVSDARKYAVAKFAGDMLVVGDNLRRARDTVPEEARAADPALAAFVEGVEMTAREMDRALEKHGVVKIEAEGERFDPHRHQAVFEAPDPSVPAGTVVQVLQTGYTIGDRVLRAAMVGVSKGGPKAANEPAKDDDMAEADAGTG